jgi:hypothetical protein
MSVNIFGSRSKFKPVVDLSVNSKFITLTKSLQLKVDKTGDTLTGNLNMGHYKINNLADPISDNDACNKKYVDELINQTNDSITNHVNFIVGNLDSINKKFEEQIETLERESFVTKISTEAKIGALEESLEEKFLNFRRKNRKRNKSE